MNHNDRINVLHIFEELHSKEDYINFIDSYKNCNDEVVSFFVKLANDELANYFRSLT